MMLTLYCPSAGRKSTAWASAARESRGLRLTVSLAVPAGRFLGRAAGPPPGRATWGGGRGDRVGQGRDPHHRTLPKVVHADVDRIAGGAIGLPPGAQGGDRPVLGSA